MTELRGARVLVTGASGGLGRAIAMGLRAQGAELVVTGRRSRPLLKLAAEVQGQPRWRTWPSPASSTGSSSEAGDVDILVANAGAAGLGRTRRLGSGSDRPGPRGQPGAAPSP